MFSSRNYTGSRANGERFANRAQVDLMLTIFGKKKKDEDAAAADAGVQQSVSAPSNISLTPASGSPPGPNSNQTPTPVSTSVAPMTQDQPSHPMRPASQQQIFRASPNAPLPTEETSLTRLLQSLLADIPLPPDVDASFGGPGPTTPDFVPVRSTPPSRPMVIGPGKDNSDSEELGEQPAKQPAPTSPSRTTKPSDVQPSTGKSPAPAPSPTVAPKKDQTPEKTADKPSKIDKQPEPPAKPAKVTRTTQGFDHIFQLTQGNLESTGLAIINGEAGSGRTTLCSGLTSNYMKMGNPCLYLTCDQSPSDLRNQMKKLGTDAAQYESSYRLIIVDGFAAQSESFSMEMYYIDQPFNFDNITESLVRNIGMFVGEKVRIILDSLDGLAAKVPSKDFTKAFTDLASKLKESGATFIITIDMSKLPKDLAGSLNELADCSVDLSKDDSDPNGRELKVQRLNHSSAKVEAETFEIDSSKGLVFV
jgi:KaiC/GvpD/RAD55 family RecA-like ATPase